jgi:hypothetical protein
MKLECIFTSAAFPARRRYLCDVLFVGQKQVAVQHAGICVEMSRYCMEFVQYICTVCMDPTSQSIAARDNNSAARQCSSIGADFHSSLPRRSLLPRMLSCHIRWAHRRRPHSWAVPRCTWAIRVARHAHDHDEAGPLCCLAQPGLTTDTSGIKWSPSSPRSLHRYPDLVPYCMLHQSTVCEVQ